MNRTYLLVLLCFAGITSAEAFQGTTVKLQCSTQRGLDLHATREPSSPVVANVKCGDTLLLLDQRFGSAHLRTEDGKDGYIVEINMGQYGFQPVSESGAPTPAPTAMPQTSPPVRQEANRASYPRLEVFGGFSLGSIGDPFEISRETLFGWQASVAGNVHRMFGIVGDFGGHYKTVLGLGVNIHEFTAGPQVTVRSEKVDGFVHFLAGGVRGSVAGFSETGLLLAAGGGVDVKVSPQIAIRIPQFDWTPSRISGVWSTSEYRIGFGVVFKLGEI